MVRNRLTFGGAGRTGGVLSDCGDTGRGSVLFCWAAAAVAMSIALGLADFVFSKLIENLLRLVGQ